MSWGRSGGLRLPPGRELAGEEGETLFQAAGGLHCGSDPEATEVRLRPALAEMDEDAGRRRQVEHHPREVLSQVRRARRAGMAGGGMRLETRDRDWKRGKSHQL